MGNAIIINNSEPREIKAKLNYARKKLFEFTGPTLNIVSLKFNHCFLIIC